MHSLQNTKAQQLVVILTVTNDGHQDIWSDDQV